MVVFLVKTYFDYYDIRAFKYYDDAVSFAATSDFYYIIEVELEEGEIEGIGL